MDRRFRAINDKRKKCTDNGCNEYHFAKGYCQAHYEIYTRSGKLKIQRRTQSDICIADGCDEKSYRQSMCNKHYLRKLKYNDTSYVEPRSNQKYTKKCIIKKCTRMFHAKGLCSTHFQQKKDKEDIAKQTNVDSWIKRRFSISRRKAQKRNLDWLLSLADFSFLAHQKCSYCEADPILVQQGSGIDRLDNKIGYVPGNVQACCYHCNTFRSSRFTVEETKKLISRLIEIRGFPCWPRENNFYEKNKL